MLIIIYFSLVFCTVICQEIPQEFFEYYKYNAQIDRGVNWDYHSTFGPLRKKQLRPETEFSDSSVFNYQAGFINQTENNDNSSILYGYEHFNFKKYFYTFLYTRIVTDVNAVPHYSGIPQEISRFGFRSGENDLAGIGYSNDWVFLQFGRGRQSWGGGNGINLALTENAAPYDFGMLGLDLGKIKYRYINGYLETYNKSQRYLSARGLEYKKDMFLISMSEIVVYSGLNRAMDFSYLNPISTHLEIELNNRQNRHGTDSGNAIWQFSADLIAKDNFRISGNFLIDELILDKVELDQGKENGIAFSLKTVFSPPIKRLGITQKLLSLYFSWIHVGTHTFRHERVSDMITGDIIGYNNFVQRGIPLGWDEGSDGEDFRLGINYFNNRNILCDLYLGIKRIGSENLKERPYEYYTDYLSGTFPSGEVDIKTYISKKIFWQFKPNIMIFSHIDYSESNHYGKNLDMKIGFNVFHKAYLNI
tara:strand:- start:249 stop:1676 length:1428 start_codon:yes stop_codon:yes gene_type:complete